MIIDRINVTRNTKNTLEKKEYTKFFPLKRNTKFGQYSEPIDANERALSFLCVVFYLFKINITDLEFYTHKISVSSRLPFFSGFGVLHISSFFSSFLFGLHTMSVTMPSARFNKEAALKDRTNDITFTVTKSSKTKYERRHFMVDIFFFLVFFSVYS